MVLDKNGFETTVLPGHIDWWRVYVYVCVCSVISLAFSLFLRQSLDSLIAPTGLKLTKWLRMTLIF